MSDADVAGGKVHTFRANQSLGTPQKSCITVPAIDLIKKFTYFHIYNVDAQKLCDLSLNTHTHTRLSRPTGRAVSGLSDGNN